MSKTRRPILLALAIMLAAGLVVLFTNPTHTTADVRQERLEIAGSPLQPDQPLAQTLHASHSGLEGVELTMARFSGFEMPQGATLNVSLYAADEQEPLRNILLAADMLEHNQRLRVSWEPIPDSANKTYTLRISSTENLPLGLWQTASEAYAYGELSQGDSALAGDLWFISYYTYDVVDALQDALTLLNKWLGGFPGLILTLFLPGWAITQLLKLGQRHSLFGRLYLNVAFSMAFWPLLMLWSGIFGINAGGLIALGLVGVLCLAALALPEDKHRLQPHPGAPEVVMGIVMVLILLARLHDIRQIVLPLWVDSVHHTVVADILNRVGGVPTNYAPYMPVDNFHYHFGFHSFAAALTWFSNLPIEKSVLLMGQMINVLAPLAAFFAAEQLTQKRWAGVLAAITAGALSYLPAYLVTWGRYTQLAGLVLLPAVLASTRDAVVRPRRLLPAGILAGALCLTHYRVLVLYLLTVPFLLLADKTLPRSRALRLIAIGATGMALISPWIFRFATHVLPRAGATYGAWSPSSGANPFSTGLLTSYWFAWLLGLAAVATLLGILEKRWKVILPAIWSALWLIAANLRWIGLADTWFLDNTAVMISLWLPVAVLCGWLGWHSFDIVCSQMQHWHHPVQEYLLVVVSIVITCAGIWHHLDIVNPVTVLAQKEDLQAMHWAKENTPEDSLFLVNSMAWQGTIHAGSDAGWWLALVAQRETTLPCVLYHQDDGPYRDEVNRIAETVEAAQSPDDPLLLDLIAERGVTHVFVGTKGGPLEPSELDSSENYRAIYISGPVRIYKVVNFSPQ